MSQKTVFLSYRRDGGDNFARSIEQALTSQGFDVFLDVDRMEPGQWEAQVAAEVPQRAHFLLLLTPGALDHCADPEDWVRREFELAVETKRNVVPVLKEPFDMNTVHRTCPESMQGLFDLQRASIRHEAFANDVRTLVDRFILPHKAPNERGHRRIASTRLDPMVDRLFGRERELEALESAWQDPKIHVVTMVAWGGVGKTSLVAKWMAELAARDYDGADFFDWPFYSQGTRQKGGASADAFVDKALRFFDDVATAKSSLSPWDKGSKLAQRLAERPTLLVLDGLESLQHPPGPLSGELKDPAIAALLKGLAQRNPGLCVVTTRVRVKDLAPFEETTAPRRPLDQLSTSAGVALLEALGVRGTPSELEGLVKDVLRLPRFGGQFRA